MFYYIAIIISLLTLLGATYTDLKERIVTNKLNFGATLLGLVLFSIRSIFEQSFFPLFYSIIGLSFGFLFGWALWKIGVFAGGDVKLFMALGALNPFTPALLNMGIFSSFQLPIFPITLFLHSLIAFLPYGFAVVLYKLIKNKKVRKEIFKDAKIRAKQASHASIVIASLHIIISFFTQNYLIEAISIFIILLIWNYFKDKKKYFTLILFVIALAMNFVLFIQVLIGTIIIIVGFYGLAKIMFSLHPLLSKPIEVEKLEEGMIPANTLMWKEKKVVEKEKLGFAQILKLTKEKKLNLLVENEKEIVSANKARGVIEEEIKELQKLAKKKLIPKTIMIKDSMPFVPTMLLGYGISLFLGDALIIMVIGL
jgi:archaeal preflagellin peptidase FlaK